MNNDDYVKKLNCNMLYCWFIISLVLSVSYIIEIFKGLRGVPYVIFYCSLSMIPVLISYILYKKSNGQNAYLKYIFAISYLILYLFSMITTTSMLTFVYIIPMMSILLSYSDKKLVLGTMGTAVIINLFRIYTEIGLVHDNGDIISFTFTECVTRWEIQLACLGLSMLFLYKTTELIVLREKLIITLSSDVTTDALTGLNNIRFLDDNIKSKFMNCDELSIAFIDVDDFKHFNTLYGHKFGDKVLSTVGNTLKSMVGTYKDTFAIRVGGDEFVIVSTTLNTDDFKDLLEKIRNKIEKTKLNYNKEKVGICISIGISNKNQDKTDVDDFTQLYNLADIRNALAKENGKNTIVSTGFDDND